MGDNAGEVVLDLVLNSKPFQSAMDKLSGTVKNSLGGITSQFSKIGKGILGALGIGSLVKFGKECLDLGSDLSEVQNVVDVTFGSMSSQVDQFAKNAAASFGLSETMAKKYTGTFGAMAKAFGFSQQEAYGMSTALTGLAGDIASFYNLSQDEAYTKLKSVFTGETESLKDLGVVMSQAALDNYALANGFGRTTSAMSEQEKVALRYAFVQDQLSLASGDFARTSGSWANQVRLLTLQFEGLKATIGQGLINVFTPILTVVNSVLSKIATLANAFKAFTELITGGSGSSGSSSIGGMADAAAAGMNSAASAADGLADSASGAGGAAAAAAKQMKALMGFDEINKVEAPESSGGGGGGGGGGGAGGGGGGAIGSAVDFGSLAEGDTFLEQYGEELEKFQKLLEPTMQSLQRLYNEGLSKLGEFAWDNLQNFFEHFLVPVGEWALGEGIPDFIDTLNEGLMNVDFDKIEESLTGFYDALSLITIDLGDGLLWIWDNILVPLGTWTANEVVPRFFDTLSTVLTILHNILQPLQPYLQWFWDNICLPIANWAADGFLTAWDSINLALTDLATATGDLSVDWDTAYATMTTVLETFQTFADEAWADIETIFTDFTTFLTDTFNGDWDSALGDLQTLQADFLTFGSLLWGLLKTAVFEPFTTWLSDTFGIDFEDAFETMQGVLADFLTFASTVWTSVQTIFEDFGTFFTDVFNGDWEAAFGDLQTIMADFLDFGSLLWTAVETVFDLFTTWLSDTFGVDWDTAWTAITDSFSTIFSSVTTTATTAINSVIGFINSMIGGFETALNAVVTKINSFSFTVPDWVPPPFGGQTWGPSLSAFTLARIPLLAKGGYVKPNTPQLAMIGDNRHQGEVVAPEDKLMEMARAAAAGGNVQLLGQIINLLETLISMIEDGDDIVLTVGDEELARSVQRGSMKLKRRYTTTEVSI